VSGVPRLLILFQRLYIGGKLRRFSPHSPLTQMSPLPSPTASPASISSSLSSFTLRAERAMMERNRRVAERTLTPSQSESEVISHWGSYSGTEVNNWPNRDDYDSGSIHSSAYLPASDPFVQWPSLHSPSVSQRVRGRSTGSRGGGSSRPSTRRSTPTPSSRASTPGPVRRRRGSIVPEDDLLDTYPPINTRANNFRFGGKTYLLTYSQIGDLPNSALEDKFNGFGNQVKSE
jgi:hypothetical protein